MARLEGGARASAESGGVEADGAPVVRIAGEIDISNIAGIEATVLQIVGEGPNRVVFDLAALEFMDSSAIGLLLRVADRCGSVELREPSTTIRRIVETMGLAGVLRIRP